MRVATPEDFADFFLRCSSPGPDAGIEQWVRFIATLRSWQQTPSTMRAIEEGQRELMRRLDALPTYRPH